ncbi:DHA2 family efflux MFS transporter permease subunit [Novosphingobium sp.]|uniref:DHA2 family efflux MFS transporter permease subunit n=1 Tax=Novosphingobium sp. TaxID=1874826 RepID=UPI003BAB57B2
MSATSKAAQQPAWLVKHRPLLFTAVMAAMVMQVLDTTIANVALPHMEASLSATQETISWVLTSYVLASAVVLPLGGWLVDRFGIRVVFTFSVIAFTAASIMCGLAQNLGQMVAFRVVQGMGGAFLSPFAQTVMLNSSTTEERPKMMALFTQGVMLGPIAGPLLGGYITESYSWRWVFFINVPIGIASGLVLWWLLPRQESVRRPIDLTGWLLVALALASFQLMLDRGPSQDWFGSAEVVTYAVIWACSAWMAVVHLVTAEKPLFPGRMFADANFVASLIFMFLIGCVMMAVLALLPGLLQGIYGYPAVDAGWLLAPRGVGLLVTITLLGRWITKMDPRLALTIGMGLSGWSLLLMSRWSPDMPMAPIFVTGLIQGVGIAFTIMPINLIAFATLPPEMRTDAAGLNNLMRSIGASIGIAVCTFMLARNIQVNHAEMGAQITRMSVPFDLDRITAYGGVSEAGMRMVDGLVNKQAAMIGYLNDFYMMGLLCWASIPVLFFVKAGNAPPAGAPQMAAADH